MIRAGPLRHEFAVQENTESGDGDGGLTDSWSTVATVWGSIRRSSEMERFNANRLQNVVTHIIETRYNSLIDEDKRILFGSRIFHIESVENVLEKGRKMILRCVEAAA